MLKTVTLAYLEGMNFGEASAKIRFNLDYGFSPFDAIEFTPGAKEQKMLAEQAAALPVAPETLEETVEVQPNATSVRASEPVEDDPWAADPTPRNTAPLNERRRAARET